MSWRPLLEGELRCAARDAAAEVAAALAIELEHQPGLADGGAGIAVALNHLGEDAACEALCERLGASLGELADDASLALGSSGVAWALAHVGAADDEDLDDVDRALLARISRDPRGAELAFGVSGLGAAALGRLDRPPARALLDGVVAALAASATHDDDGATWWSGTHVTLGRLSGVAGVITLLARAVRADVAPAAPLLHAASAWLWARRSADGGWPAQVLADGATGRGRPGWCSGPLGIATSLYEAAEALGDAPRAAAAWTAVVELAERGEPVREACLCHGTAGLAHLCARWYQRTGEPRLAAVAARWYAATLAHRRAGEGVAGFVTDEAADTAGARSRPGLLLGAAGIALALHAAATDHEPSWDQALLL